MPTASNPGRASALCPIRVRVTLDEHGDRRTAFSVHCPSRERSMDLRECGRCPHAHAVVGSPDALVLACDPPDPIAPTHVPVRDAMRAEVLCLLETSRIGAVRERALREDAGFFPVVDAKDRPVGTASAADLANAPDADATVGSVARDSAIAIPESAPLAAAAALMAHEGVDALFVIDDDHAVVGTISARDVLRWWARDSGYVVAS